MRQVQRTGGLEGGGVAVKIRVADLEELRDRDVYALGGAQHLQEQRLAQGKVRGGVAARALEPALQALHRLGGGGVGRRELLLRGRIRNGREHRRHVLAIEARKATEAIDAALDEARRQGRARLARTAAAIFGMPARSRGSRAGAAPAGRSRD